MPISERTTRRLAAISIAIAVFGPLGWAHYYIVPILLAPALVVLRSGVARALSIILCGILLSAYTLTALPDFAFGLNWPSTIQTLAIIALLPLFALPKHAGVGAQKG